MIFLKNLLQGAGLATLSFNRYNMAQGLLGRSCFKYLNVINKNYLFPYLQLKKNLKIPKIYFFCLWLFLKKTLIPFSYDRESLVTSLLVYL